MSEREPVTDENREIGRVAADIFGGQPEVHTWWDEDRRFNVDILSCAQSPRPDVTAYATLTLSNHPLTGTENGLRVELMGACLSSVELFPKMLASCAFNIIENDPRIGPGAVFKGAVSLFNLSTSLEHVVFIPPFLDDDSRQILTLTTRTVGWLRALPISDAEARLVHDRGYLALVDALNAKRPDVHDLGRPSVV